MPSREGREGATTSSCLCPPPKPSASSSPPGQALRREAPLPRLLADPVCVALRTLPGQSWKPGLSWRNWAKTCGFAEGVSPPLTSPEHPLLWVQILCFGVCSCFETVGLGVAYSCHRPQHPACGRAQSRFRLRPDGLLPICLTNREEWGSE